MLVSPSPRPSADGWRLEHTYAQLPARLFTPVAPTPVPAPAIVMLNRALAAELGLTADALAGPEGAAILAGNLLPPGAVPIAQAYSGHQYGHFTTLGDGRAILLGEQRTPAGALVDIQLKGSGPTPYSRQGDGRATLGPMLREYVISEAMQALGIPTTRSLAVVATGATVWRERALPGAVLTRVAASHLRVGTFEGAAAQRDEPALRALVDYTLQRHFPEAADRPNPALALLESVVARQAALLARWMLVGFVHGVMNTDNMALSGETIDYGPCAFIDAYDPATVFSSIDRHGRYAYGNQPSIAQWNLARFGETLLPLLHDEENEAVTIGTKAVQAFLPQYDRNWLAGMRRKLGLFNEEPEDAALANTLLQEMQQRRADFTNTFAALSVVPDESARGATATPTGDGPSAAWRDAWQARLRRQPQSRAEVGELQRANNPAFIPRNHRVEGALAAAVTGDLRPFEQLLDILSRPYDHERVAPEDREPAGADAGRFRTYCGT